MLDLASLCLGTPTLDNGFVDVPMKKIVEATGMSQRRCERAIADIKEAGLMEVKQPRRINEQGKYVGLRAVRVIRAAFFEFLNLGPMLEQERARATERLRRRAQKANRKLTDMMRRACQGLKRAFARPEPTSREREARLETSRHWNLACGKLMLAGVPVSELRQRVNAELGLPPDFSPGAV
jgi:DNA-binding transcriptional ArsR family regulator